MRRNIGTRKDEKRKLKEVTETETRPYKTNRYDIYMRGEERSGEERRREEKTRREETR